MKNNSQVGMAIVVVSAAVLGVTSAVEAQAPPPKSTKSVVTGLGTIYCVYEDFLPTLDAKVAQIRASVRDERAKGKFIGYISVPLSSTGGGSMEINGRVSADLKARLEADYANRVWMLSPSAVEAAIPEVSGLAARGQEYMYMWTQVLAGDDGRGRDFDFFYFVGPSDFWRVLNLTPQTSIATLEKLADKAGLSGDAKRTFVSYYAFRASATASKGAHDEWNLLRLINEIRRSDKAYGIGSQIASYFDSRAVEIDDQESAVTTGYEGPCR
jgi:hypothetical protein